MLIKLGLKRFYIIDVIGAVLGVYLPAKIGGLRLKFSKN
jgi:hypothetical protein